MLKIKACAKINLSLNITGLRHDGYHLLETVMQSVDLYDEISIATEEKGINIVSSNSSLGNEDDICYKAASLFFECSGVSGGVRISVTKNIPLSAGLGGGSADAAAVLLGLNRLFDYPLDNNALLKLAVQLGADVPYFLYGGTVLVRGIGEICETVDDIPFCYIVLAKREQKKSTKYMYSMVDNADLTLFADTKNILLGLKNGNLKDVAKNCVNAFSVAWDDKITTEILCSFKPLCVSLSGSGPTHFAIFDNEVSAINCVESLKCNNIEAFLTRPTQKAIIFE